MTTLSRANGMNGVGERVDHPAVPVRRERLAVLELRDQEDVMFGSFQACQ